MTTTFKQSPMLLAALEYAARGWHVFPVPPGTKKSFKAAQFSDNRKWGATVDHAEIATNSQKWPDANLGIVTGPKSGFWVLDIDTTEGHKGGADGFENLAELTRQYGALPHTIASESPRGSRHYFFAWPESGGVWNSASVVAPGIDVRGDGGMVVVVPSIVPGAGAYTNGPTL